MAGGRGFSRRNFLRAGALAALSASRLRGRAAARAALGPVARPVLEQFGYGDVSLAAGLPLTQLGESHGVLMELSDDSLLRPLRSMAGKAAPGEDIGGWYCYDPDYQVGKSDAGFAPGHSLGQWISALARGSAISGSSEARDKARRLNQLLAEAISGDYFEKTRFPAYSYDKLVCGLIDSHAWAADGDAFSVLDKVTEIALPHLPAKAIEREVQWRPGKDDSYGWDESYTLPENLFLAGERGAGDRYRQLAARYLMDESFFDPLSRNENVLARRHAYSTVNSLSSGMQAYLANGSEKHLLAVKNAYNMLMAQSYATGGWGPDEQLSGPDQDALFASLGKTHNSFETPCGAYAHVKLTRYLLRLTGEAQYGDSMERVIYNTVFGVKRLQPDGKAFYYSDYNYQGRRVFSDHQWPCCSGTLPQIAADYGISSYYRSGRDLYVNLYLASTVRWDLDGVPVRLTQRGEYPLEHTMRLTLSLPRTERFALLLRIPAWSAGASVAVNGERVRGIVAAGSFLRVERKWKGGDEIAVTLPMELRLEAIDPRHPETVALLRGPLVLFAVGDRRPELSRKQLLAARQVEQAQWVVEAAGGTVRFAPFSNVGDLPYSTYLHALDASS